jgi:hypothetical protein
MPTEIFSTRNCGTGVVDTRPRTPTQAELWAAEPEWNGPPAEDDE